MEKLDLIMLRAGGFLIQTVTASRDTGKPLATIKRLNYFVEKYGWKHNTSSYWNGDDEIIEAAWDRQKILSKHVLVLMDEKWWC